MAEAKKTDRQTLKRWLLAGLLVGVVTVGALNLMKGSGPKQFLVTTPSGGQILADVAESPEEQLLGLFFIKSMPDNRGFLLVFDEPSGYFLTTRGAHFPIDLVWINPRYQVIHLEENLPPCPEEPCPRYGPEEPDAAYILHLASGVARREGIAKDASLKLKLFRRDS